MRAPASPERAGAPPAAAGCVTELICAGFTLTDEGVAAKALESLGISLDAVRLQVEEFLGQGQQAPSGHIPFTPRAKKVLKLSLQPGHGYIGTEHILLGLLREGDGVAAQVLVKLGADLNRVRQQVIELLYGHQGQDKGSAGSRPGERAPAGLPEEALARIDALDRRLTALERWVSMEPDLEDLDREIAQVRREKEAAIERQDFEATAASRAREKKLLAAGLTGRRSKRGPLLAGGQWPGNWTGWAPSRKGCGRPCASTASSRATTLHRRPCGRRSLAARPCAPRTASSG